MNQTQLLRFMGWSALVSAAMTVLGFVTFMLFIALIPQSGAGNVWGPINDATSVAGALANIVVVYALHRLYRRAAPRASRAALVAGIAALLVAAVMQALLVLKVITYADTAVAVPAAFGVFGMTLVVFCLIARRAGDWSSRQVWFGILAGAGYLLTIAGFLLGGMDSPATYVGGLLAVIFYTAWAVGFGRSLLGSASRHTLARAPVAE